MHQSTELTGGAGFVYESYVAAYFMSALLAETVRLPLQSKIKSVRLQQASLGAPLDDIIIELDSQTTTRVHFQVKRSLIISSSKTNKDFKDIIINSWKTHVASKQNCSSDVYGALTDDISNSSLRVAQRVCVVARSSESSESFWALETKESKKFKDFITIIREILKEAQIPATPAELYEFLRGLYIETLNIINPSSPLASAAINELKITLQSEHRATELWEYLKGIAREGAGQGATYNKQSLRKYLQLFPFKKDSTRQATPVGAGIPGTGRVQATPIICTLAFSHVGFESSDVALSALIVTDEPNRLFDQIRSWKERIARSALITDKGRPEIAQQTLKGILAQPMLAAILLHDLAVADFSAYIYYAKKCEAQEWSESKCKLELKVLPLFHRLSKRGESISEIYSTEIDINEISETAASLVTKNYHREAERPNLNPRTGKAAAILELADVIAHITAGFISGDQIATSQIGYIKTRIRYGENVMTRERHVRDSNPLA